MRFSDEVDVTIGSLDEPERVAPKDDTHTDSKIAWVMVDDRIPAFAGARPEGKA